MRFRKLPLAVLLAVAAVPVPATPQAKTDPALDKVRSVLLAAFAANDATKLASLYTTDATLMPPDEPAVKGRAQIEAFYAAGFKAGVGDLRLLPLESSTSGTMGFEAGSFDVQVKPGGGRRMLLTGGGGAVRQTGKYVLVFRRSGSDWQIAYDIHNNDTPAHEARDN